MTYEITGYWRFAQVVLDAGLQGWASEGGRFLRKAALMGVEGGGWSLESERSSFLLGNCCPEVDGWGLEGDRLSSEGDRSGFLLEG